MSQIRYWASWAFLTTLLPSWFAPHWENTLSADDVMLKNRMTFSGAIGPVSSLSESSLSQGESATQLIILIDDGLRRTFVSKHQLESYNATPLRLEKIDVEQRLPTAGSRIYSVGQILAASPFDQWGRRTVRMMTADGVIDVHQGITEVTPIYTKVEGYLVERPYIWDMRIATSSIPRSTLSALLMHSIDASDPDQRLAVVRLYTQSARYEDAEAELERAIQDFPELANLRQESTALRQLGARRMVAELRLRSDAGHHQQVQSMLQQFPHEGVAGEILVEVGELAQSFQKAAGEIERVKEMMATHLDQIEDANASDHIKSVCDEIAGHLNHNNLNRMADYLRLGDDKALAAEQKLALAVSNWLMGHGEGIENLSVALALAEVRTLVRNYLATELRSERDAILQQLESLEGSTVENIAKLLAHMMPPRAPASPVPDESVTEERMPGRPDGSRSARDGKADDGPAGLHELTVAGLTGEEPFEYLVQLPPEYDPYRLYPTIVTLHGAGTSPELQLDWWAGVASKDSGVRQGQAGRNGYIVIAPRWQPANQRRYGYSAREHAAVLFSLRDACHQFSIDTDRVFLTGHSMGGDAAWDIGLAHPDLWAGVIPIVAVSEYDRPDSPRYIRHYSDNAKMVPLYFVAGGNDGNKLSDNGRDWDRYLRTTGYEAIVVAYRGRGHEHFQEEIHRLFQWMGLHKRDFHPKEFRCVSLRPWDNFFWWAELDGVPARSTILPVAWPPGSTPRPAITEGRILPNNHVWLKSAAERTTLWLSPEMVDFSDRIHVNGRREKELTTPSVEVLLEDARTRADRLHPFWAKIEVRGRR